MPDTLLTTGKAARLCSVKPDTVLKWIKKGRVPAIRTIGGHYRVEEADLLEILSEADAGTEKHEAPLLCGRPMRCWEYMNNGPGAECRDCVVYQVRASFCFRLVSQCQGNGHAKRFCNGMCVECPYYRLVHGAATNVLVISQDEALIQDLAKHESESLALRFARRGYDASAIISVFRPAYVVIDQAILDRLGNALLDALASDPRTAGTRIVLAVRKGEFAHNNHHRKVFATVEEPFDAAEIAALVNRVPVETLPDVAEG